MKTNKTIILAGTALAGTAIAGLFAGTAMAQSTGSQAVEVIIKGGPRSTGGLATQTNQAKDQSIVGKEYIEHLTGSANFAQAINLVPGVSFSTEDPSGMTGGDIRIHGYDGPHLSFTLDGTPLNDTGNYAIYPGEYGPAEAIDHITVNTGQTEVDSPTASAVGGTVNIVTKIPDATPSIDINPEVGSYNFQRLYAGLNTGAVGPTGIRGFFAVDEQSQNKYLGSGRNRDWNFNGTVYQPLDNGGFLSLGGTWASNRNYPYYDLSVAQIAADGRTADYNTTWIVPTAVNGKADGVPSGAAGTIGNDTNFWALHPNPVDFGDIRGHSRFNFGDKITLTVDPYLFYTLANGGGATALSECDARLVGTSYGTTGTCGTAVNGVGGGNGVDLNHDGDVKDTVTTYSASETRTHRIGLNSSFIYRFTDSQLLQATYTFDSGHHRQTGDFTTVNQATGVPSSVFGSINGYGPAILTSDGLQLQTRNRRSVAELNQFSLNYVGRFMDDKLHVNIGVRDPHFERDLHQYCDSYNGSTAYCDSVSQSLVTAALATDYKTGGAPGSKAAALSKLLGVSVYYGADGKTDNFRAPFDAVYKYTKMLPNLGASYNFNDNNQVYVTYSEGFSAPKTDDLYVSTPELVKPETTDNYGTGYRYKNSVFNASVNLWAADWKNHIVQSTDPNDATLTIDRNVGGVKLYGLDLEGAWRATPNFNLYGSMALQHSALQDNYVVAYTTGPDAYVKSGPLPVKGKSLVMAPDQTASLRGTYHVGDFSLSLESKYTGKRWIDDINSASIKSNIVTNLDAQYKLPDLGKGSVLQLNVYNLFNTQYWSRTTTVGNATVVTNPSTGDGIGSSTYYLYRAAPIEAFVSLKTKF